MNWTHRRPFQTPALMGGGYRALLAALIAKSTEVFNEVAA